MDEESGTAGGSAARRPARAMRSRDAELANLGSLGFRKEFLDYLSDFQFSGDVDAMPEETVAFAAKPLLRVTAPRIEPRLLECCCSTSSTSRPRSRPKRRVVLAASRAPTPCQRA
jgi:nicotinate phosphoribosyltransferase